ncbi:MAG: DUF2442 domain-containing protein [Dehalococcoidia bacterium]|nr:DUF2442 domain-containing protein [Dehalococcoidia bacterium]
MKLDIYYDSTTDTLSLWNGRPANEGADVAENLIVDFGRDGEVVGFTLDHAAESLGPFLSQSEIIHGFYVRTETKASSARAQSVLVTEDTLSVDLSDGRSVSVPLSWYPRLAHGTPKERDNWRIEGAGWGVHWPDLDEDISVKGLLMGNSSKESGKSFKRWLENRVAQDKGTGSCNL